MATHLVKPDTLCLQATRYCSPFIIRHIMATGIECVWVYLFVSLLDTGTPSFALCFGLGTKRSPLFYPGAPAKSALETPTHVSAGAAAPSVHHPHLAAATKRGHQSYFPRQRALPAEKTRALIARRLHQHEDLPPCLRLFSDCAIGSLIACISP